MPVKIYLVMDNENCYSGYAYYDKKVAEDHAGRLWNNTVLEVEPRERIAEWVVRDFPSWVAEPFEPVRQPDECHLCGKTLVDGICPEDLIR